MDLKDIRKELSLHEDINLGIFVIKNNKLEYVNEYFYHHWGYMLEDLKGKAYIRFTKKEYTKPLEHKLVTASDGNVLKESYEILVKNKGGRVSSAKILCIQKAPNDDERVYGIMVANNESKSDQHAFSKLDKILKQIDRAIIVLDDNHKVHWVNNSFEKLTGYREHEVTSNIFEMLNIDSLNSNIVQMMDECVQNDENYRSHIAYKNKAGKICPALFSITKIKNNEENKNRSILILKDAVKYPLTHDKVIATFYRDAVTELPNKYYFMDHLTTELQHKDRGRFSLLLIDIDRFKNINELYGRTISDNVLKIVASKLKSFLKESDFIGRVEGDRFAIIYKESFGVEDYATKMIKELQYPIIINELDIYIVVCIGIVKETHYFENSYDILNAVGEMIESKKPVWKSFYTVYTSEKTTRPLAFHSLEAHIRTSINKKEFLVYYQPKMELKTKKIVGAEALVRWNHPMIGVVSPKDFIRLAEETGIIEPIDEIVLEHTFLQNKNWYEKGYELIPISINISITQFYKLEFYQNIEKLTALNHHLNNVIEIDITEGVLMRDLDLLMNTVKMFEKLGFKISIDNFGTSFSSISYLKKLPIKNINIDRSFIKDIDQNEHSRSVVKAIIAMAHGLGIKVTAEGVEKEEQMKLLESYDCDLIQGYFISQPINANDFEKFLNKRSS